MMRDSMNEKDQGTPERAQRQSAELLSNSRPAAPNPLPNRQPPEPHPNPNPPQTPAPRPTPPEPIVIPIPENPEEIPAPQPSEKKRPVKKGPPLEYD